MAMPEMSAPPAPAGQPMPEGEAPGGQDMKPMLLKVLLKVKQTAEGAGLDFAQLVAEATGGEAGAMPSPEGAAPRSPSPAAMMPPAGM